MKNLIFTLTAIFLSSLALAQSEHENESFEIDLGLWTQSSSDDIDWTRKSGSTPSSSTGPSTASDGSYYIYVEASSPNYPSKTAVLTSTNLSIDANTEFSFDYHMYGAAMGSLTFSISPDNGNTWQDLWTKQGNQNNDWITAKIDLSPYGESTVMFRFSALTGTSYTSDIVIDNFVFKEIDPSVIYEEGFEQGFGSWTQSTSDDFDWTRKSGSTTSGNTGPSIASDGSYYLYVETSGSNHPNKTTIITSSNHSLTNNNELIFDYHMYGATMGSLTLSVSTDGGGTWQNLWSLQGNQGDTWSTEIIDLNSYSQTTALFRFTAISGTSFTGDSAIDNFKIIQPTSSTNCTGSNEENYIYSLVPRIPVTDVTLLANDEKIESITYFDGLGKPMQNIAIRGGSNQEDIITHIGYDGLGRQAKDYLSYPKADNCAAFETDAKNTTDTYYLAEFPNELDANNPNPFSEKHFEASPLNRLLEQGAPGEDWLLDKNNNSDHSIKFEYSTNDINEVKRYSINFPNGNTENPQLSFDGYYNADNLSKTITKDENWQPGQTHPKDHTTEEFKDLEGRVVLKRTYNEGLPHDTQYVYDDFGNLTFVIPPLASDLLVTQNSYTDFTDVIPASAFTNKWGGDITVSLSGLNLTLDVDLTWTAGGFGGTFPLVYEQLSEPIPDLDFETGFGDYNFIINNEFLVSEETVPFPSEMSSWINTYMVQVPEYTIEQDILDNLCYQYKYDHRNRLIEKKIPGKGWEYIIYNKLDQPILTQDANLRLDEKWLFTKYDVLGRVTYTGLHTYSPIPPPGNPNPNYVRTSLQTMVSAHSTQYEASGNVTLDGINTFYTNDAFPTTNIVEVHTINYYDSYNSHLTTVASDPVTVFGRSTTSDVKSLTTGNITKVLNTTSPYWITSITYYDDKARPIYSASENEYLETIDILETELDFSGKALQTKSTHSKGTNADIIVTDSFTYDHYDRLISQIQNVNGQGQELIVKNHFDELGQLMNKDVGNTEVTPLQSIDYSYNIRGWLKEINDISSLGNDLFSFKINYNTQDLTSSNNPLYNGNIGETRWLTANDNIERNYSYSYDALNRIVGADFDNDYSGSDPLIINENFNVSNLSYDKNGNIKTLYRYGRYYQTPLYSGLEKYDQIDKLIYSYEPSSNRLKSVNDKSTNFFGFSDDGNGSYIYDNNGNMTYDPYKDLTFEYNHLNLPFYIENGHEINYIYDASGVKLAKMVNDNGTLTTTRYAGNFIYKEVDALGEELQFFSQSEGYVEPDGSGGFDYIYQYKDHLGNIRLSYKNTGPTSSPTLQIQEENNYYPFGLKHKGYNNVVNSTNKALDFTFNGKEFEESLGLGLYEYGSRMFDPAIARFTSIDPLAHEFMLQSPYVYGANNPIYFEEKDGENPIVGAFVSGALEILGQVGSSMLDGKSFRSAVKDIQWSDVGWEAGSGALSGFIGDPGIGKFVKFVKKKRNRKLINKVFGEILEYAITSATEIAKKVTKNEEIDLGATLVDGLVGAGLEKLIPDTEFFGKYLKKNEKRMSKLEKSIGKLENKTRGNKKKKKRRQKKIEKKKAQLKKAKITNNLLQGAQDLSQGVIDRTIEEGVIRLKEVTVQGSSNN